VATGKNANLVTTAVAREMAAFLGDRVPSPAQGGRLSRSSTKTTSEEKGRTYA
jgi:hypothetical protein